MIVASFWVYRPEQFPNAADYPAMLRILQRSCDRLGLAHVCLTDLQTYRMRIWPEGVAAFAPEMLPEPLMQACTEVQARWLEQEHTDRRDTLFVGADCIMKKTPRFPSEPDLCVTYRTKADNYPINTGAVFVPARGLERTRPLFRRIADRCGEVWCDDQRAVRAELEPMPDAHGTYDRAGMKVAFLPMAPYNVLPRSAGDPARGAYMVHFRGKERKQLFFDWAERWGYAGE